MHDKPWIWMKVSTLIMDDLAGMLDFFFVSCTCNLFSPLPMSRRARSCQGRIWWLKRGCHISPAIGTCTVEVEFRWVVVSPTYFAWRITRLEGFQRYEKSIPSWRNVVDEFKRNMIKLKWAMKKLGLFKDIEGIMLPSYLVILIYHGSYLWWNGWWAAWRLTVDIQATRMVYGSRDLVHVQDLQFGPVARSIFWMRLWMRWGWADFYLEVFFCLGWVGLGVSKSWGTDSAEGPVGALGLSYILHVQNVGVEHESFSYK